MELIFFAEVNGTDFSIEAVNEAEEIGKRRTI